MLKPSTPIAVLTTGGTFDKIYFDAKSKFEVGDSTVSALLDQGVVNHPYEITEIMRKDSLELRGQGKRADPKCRGSDWHKMGGDYPRDRYDDRNSPMPR